MKRKKRYPAKWVRHRTLDIQVLRIYNIIEPYCKPMRHTTCCRRHCRYSVALQYVIALGHTHTQYKCSQSSFCCFLYNGHAILLISFQVRNSYIFLIKFKMVLKWNLSLNMSVSVVCFLSECECSYKFYKRIYIYYMNIMHILFPIKMPLKTWKLFHTIFFALQ